MTDENSDRTERTDDRTDTGLPPGHDDDAGKSALSPEELDIAESEYVEKLDDNGRYVVSSGGGPPTVPDSTVDRSAPDERRDGIDPESRERQPDRSARSPEAARTLLANELDRSNARYGLDIVARFEGETVRHRTVSDDVIGTFEGLVRWYAGHVTDGTPPDEVVDILLGESTFETDETPNLAKLLDRHDLDRSDSIEDLVAAIRVESGID